MTIIAATTIEYVYLDCLKKASNAIDVSKWIVKPTGVGLDTHKSKYGQATKEGKVLINPAFIGTTAMLKLRVTINHELAHLIVGFAKNHNRVFKRVEGYLNHGIDVTEAEKNTVKLNNGFKYRILGFTETKTYDCGWSFRRTAKFTKYNPKGPRTMSIKGERFQRFEYVDFDAPLPEGTITEL